MSVTLWAFRPTLNFPNFKGDTIMGISASSLIGPIVGAVKGIYSAIAMIPAAINIVELVSKIFKGTPSGDEKHRAAVEIIKNMIMAGEGISQKDIVDEEAFAVGLDVAIDGIVAMLNASIWYKKAGE